MTVDVETELRYDRKPDIFWSYLKVVFTKAKVSSEVSVNTFYRGYLRRCVRGSLRRYLRGLSMGVSSRVSTGMFL